MSTYMLPRAVFLLGEMGEQLPHFRRVLPHHRHHLRLLQKPCEPGLLQLPSIRHYVALDQQLHAPGGVLGRAHLHRHAHQALNKLRPFHISVRVVGVVGVLLVRRVEDVLRVGRGHVVAPLVPRAASPVRVVEHFDLVAEEEPLW